MYIYVYIYIKVYMCNKMITLLCGVCMKLEF